jgi:CRISPR-associated protein (TIGR02710 family)
MAKAMIVSVGGTPEPIIITLDEERPEFVCFLASQQSVDQIADIKRRTAVSCRDEKELTEDPDDLVECYRKALACIDRVRRQGISLDDTLVDYTGGTKVMGAALAMAAGSYNVRFSYVGGTARTKGGLGTVETGSEHRRIDRNPWQLFAVEEKRRVAQFFNAHQYVAARDALAELVPRLTGPDRLILDALREMTDGYGLWDRFEHNAALKVLSEARRKLAERTQAASMAEYDPLIETAAQNVSFLGELASCTKGFAKLHPALAVDLVANAERRIEEGKFDDAVARLYRAVEIVGQAAFEAAFGVPNGKVPSEIIPQELREEFTAKYGDGSLLKLPLTATFRTLMSVGDAAGRRFGEHQEELRKVLDARNYSVLAHGLRPLAKETAARLRDIVCSFLPSDARRPAFPKLPS